MRYRQYISEVRRSYPTKAAYIIDDVTGNKKIGNKVHVLVRLRSSKSGLAHFSSLMHVNKTSNNDFRNLFFGLQNPAGPFIRMGRWGPRDFRRITRGLGFGFGDCGGKIYGKCTIFRSPMGKSLIFLLEYRDERTDLAFYRIQVTQLRSGEV